MRVHGGNSFRYQTFRNYDSLECRYLNSIHLCVTRQARRIAPEKMSLQLADILYKMYFMERNIKLLVDYTSSWPVLSFPAYAIPEILYIWLLSEVLKISSPVPKLPFVDPGLGHELQHFGWSGSVGFSTAAMLPKKLPSKEPNNIAASAVQHVMYEIEESVSMSTSLDNGIFDIETCSSSSSGSTDKSIIVSSNSELTSPMPARKNHSKCREKDHSNKGGVGSHKISHQKLQLTLKV